MIGAVVSEKPKETIWRWFVDNQEVVTTQDSGADESVVTLLLIARLRQKGVC